MGIKIALQSSNNPTLKTMSCKRKAAFYSCHECSDNRISLLPHTLQWPECTTYRDTAAVQPPPLLGQRGMVDRFWSCQWWLDIKKWINKDLNGQLWMGLRSLETPGMCPAIALLQGPLWFIRKGPDVLNQKLNKENWHSPGSQEGRWSINNN